jgi:hypothetical protein
MQATKNGRKWTTEHPELGTGPLSVEAYVLPEYEVGKTSVVLVRARAAQEPGMVPDVGA